MTKKELILIKTIVEEKTISGAAKKLYIAQPSLSQSLKKIEESLGTSLFNRTPSGLSMTYAGECYYKTACQILKLYDDLESEVSDINNLKTGRIRLGITNHLGTLMLHKVLPVLLNKAPGLEIQITEEGSTVLERELLEGRLDVVLDHAPGYYEKPCIDYMRIKRDPFVIAMNRDDPAGKEAQVREGYPFPVLDVKMLKDHKFILLHKEQRIRQVSDKILENAGIYQPDIRIEVKSFGTAQLLAAKGLGATFIPKQYIPVFNTEDVDLSYYSIDEKYGGYWDVSITTLKNLIKSNAEKLLIKITKEEIGKEY